MAKNYCVPRAILDKVIEALHGNFLYVKEGEDFSEKSHNALVDEVTLKITQLMLKADNNDLEAASYKRLDWKTTEGSND